MRQPLVKLAHHFVTYGPWVGPIAWRGTDTEQIRKEDVRSGEDAQRLIKQRVQAKDDVFNRANPRSCRVVARYVIKLARERGGGGQTEGQMDDVG